jgi:DNA mismatch endonuclease, patch repair protein
VDGCFWHACPEHGGRPANNVWYWEPKLRKNVERDRAADAALAAAGWDVVRVWEHEPLDAAVTAVLAALSGSQPPHTRPERDGPDLDRAAARARSAPAEEPDASAEVPPGG